MPIEAATVSVKIERQVRMSQPLARRSKYNWLESGDATEYSLIELSFVETSKLQSHSLPETTLPGSEFPQAFAARQSVSLTVPFKSLESRPH